MKLIKYICVFIVSIVACKFCMQSSYYKNYVVPGTVVSKNIEQYAHGKNNINISKRYIIYVKPNDTNKFNNYSAYVDYKTYCTYNIGDKIDVSISEEKCIRNFERSVWVEEISCIMFALFLFLSIFSFIGVTVVIVESYLNDLW